MRSVLFLALAFSSTLASAAPAVKILDCNLSFGDIAQIQVMKTGDQYSYNLLTNSGSWKPGFPLSAEQWESKDIKFQFRFENYRVFSSDKGRSWEYTSTPLGSTQPDTTGGADCE